MKGVIFNVVEDAVVSQYGDAAWEQVLERAGLDGAYTSMGSYPDHDFTALIVAGAEMLGTEPDELTRQLGHAALLGLAERYPRFMTPFDSTRPFLLTLNDVIHPEVRKLHSGSEPPDFAFDVSDPDVLGVHYHSRRRLCPMAVGMIHGAATYYGEQARVEEVACKRDGADHCELRVGFTPGTA